MTILKLSKYIIIDLSDIIKVFSDPKRKNDISKLDSIDKFVSKIYRNNKIPIIMVEQAPPSFIEIRDSASDIIGNNVSDKLIKYTEEEQKTSTPALETLSLKLIEYWSSLPGTAKHKTNKPYSKTVKNMIQLLIGLMEGKFGEGKYFYTDWTKDIPESWFTKKWSYEELKSGIELASRYCLKGYWPTDKKFFKSLENILYNERANSHISWLFDAINDPPEPFKKFTSNKKGERKMTQLKDVSKKGSFLSFGELSKKYSKRVGGKISNAPNRITYKVIRSKNKEGKERSPQILIVIGEFYMQEANFIKGDRIDILFSPEDRMGIIKRVSNDVPNLKICAETKNGERGRIHGTWRPGMPYYEHSVMLTGIECTRGELMFDFPESQIDVPQSILKGYDKD